MYMYLLSLFLEVIQYNDIIKDGCVKYSVINISINMHKELIRIKLFWHNETFIIWNSVLGMLIDSELKINKSIRKVH